MSIGLSWAWNWPRPRTRKRSSSCSRGSEEKTKDQTERLRIDTEFTKINLPLLMGKHRLELEKLQVARNLGEERLKKLIADREAMIVKAPIDGIVYYGRSVRGKWSAMSVETLRRGASIMPNDVFMTVVQTRPL